jgi:hypothetical protein
VLPDGSSLLFDPATDAGHVLDAVGSLVWDYCDGALSEDEIADEVAGLLPDETHLSTEVRRLLADFAQAGLLASAPQPEDYARESPTQ